MIPELPTRSDAVVVGAGVIGLAVGYELARHGCEVIVLDRDDVPGVASRAAAGMLAPTSEADLADEPMVALELDSLRRYPAFVEGLEALTGRRCGRRTEGTLLVALTRDDVRELERLAAFQHSKGLSAMPLSPEAVQTREPHLSGRVVAGLLVEGDHQVDPRELSGALASAVELLGGCVACGYRVTRIEDVDGGAHRVSGTVAGRPFAVGCEVAVVAAGVWSTEVEAALPPLPLRPVKGQLVRLRGPVLLRHVVRSPGVYLVPREDGELLLGATVEEQGFDSSATAGAVLDLLREAWRVVPGIYDLALAELSVGFRPAVPDHRPVIGRGAVGGLYVATAHFRNGILLAPATAHYLAEWITTGRPPAELRAFTPERLATTLAVGAAPARG